MEITFSPILPKEIWTSIIEKCEPSTICKASQLSSFFFSLINEFSLREKAIERRFIRDLRELARPHRTLSLVDMKLYDCLFSIFSSTHPSFSSDIYRKIIETSPCLNPRNSKVNSLSSSLIRWTSWSCTRERTLSFEERGASFRAKKAWASISFSKESFKLIVHCYGSGRDLKKEIEHQAKLLGKSISAEATWEIRGQKKATRGSFGGRIAFEEIKEDTPLDDYFNFTVVVKSGA